MAVLAEDRRAHLILTDMYWTSAGWRKDPQRPADGDYRRGLDAGYLFEPAVLRHDEVVDELTTTGASPLRDAVQAFVASLSARRLFLRPFLPSAVVAATLPKHRFVLGRSGCSVCGLAEKATVDLNVLNFERHKWGGVRHLDLGFVWFCLRRLEAEGGGEPGGPDEQLLLGVLDQLRQLPAGVSSTTAEAALRTLKSNKDERLALIESLAVCSVLEDPEHPGFLFRFVNEDDRRLPDQRFADRGYPAAWWKSDHGLNEAAVTFLFGDRG